MATSKNAIKLRNSNGVYYFVDYHKVHLGGEKNPKFEEDRASHVILDLKDDTNRKYEIAVQDVTELIGPRLKDVVKENTRYLLAVIPSSEAGKWSPGLEAFIEATSKKNRYFTPATRLLKRHTKIAKLARGGRRGAGVHLASVKVQNSADVKGKRILLIDDITTTGNSFAACKQLLEDAGAAEVVCVAIAKTADD
jgi:predicted amidophosphoribosyltransferase